MKYIAIEEILSAVPTAVPMTKRQKLERWADLISQQSRRVTLVHNLEKWGDFQLNCPITGHYAGTAFYLAATDPTFRQLGLVDTVAGIMKFFELDQHNLHEFSCDCGGSISNKNMVRRLRNIADPSWSGWISRLFR